MPVPVFLCLFLVYLAIINIISSVSHAFIACTHHLSLVPFILEQSISVFDTMTVTEALSWLGRRTSALS